VALSILLLGVPTEVAGSVLGPTAGQALTLPAPDASARGWFVQVTLRDIGSVTFVSDNLLPKVTRPFTVR
jgi:hypothetical protein